MGLKAEIAKIFAKYNYKKEQNWIKHPIETQEKTFHKLITEATKTQFGKDHQFHSIKSYEDFKSKVPINDYEGLKSYIENRSEEHTSELQSRGHLVFRLLLEKKKHIIY